MTAETKGNTTAREQQGQKAVAKRLMRMAQILRVFLEKEQVSTDLLCRMFATTPRTIQRDLKTLRESGFAIHEELRGLHRLDKGMLKNLDVYDESELALILALKDLVGHLGSPFAKAADSVFNRLYDYGQGRPVFVKIDEPTRLSQRSMGRIVQSILSRRNICFTYSVRSSYTVEAEPYRIAYFQGIWYLVARDKAGGVIKKYALDKMTDIKTLKTTFRDIPADIDQILDQSTNIWFSGKRDIEVLIEAAPMLAGYFERRVILPCQEITHKNPDGAISVRFKAGSFEEVSLCLKPWLPHVRILSPESMRGQLTQEMQTWLTWQEAL